MVAHAFVSGIYIAMYLFIVLSVRACISSKVCWILNHYLELQPCAFIAAGEDPRLPMYEGHGSY